jgi:hypothetical protein
MNLILTGQQANLLERWVGMNQLLKDIVGIAKIIIHLNGDLRVLPE